MSSISWLHGTHYLARKTSTWIVSLLCYMFWWRGVCGVRRKTGSGPPDVGPQGRLPRRGRAFEQGLYKSISCKWGDSNEIPAQEGSISKGIDQWNVLWIWKVWEVMNKWFMVCVYTAGEIGRKMGTRGIGD